MLDDFFVHQLHRRKCRVLCASKDHHCMKHAMTSMMALSFEMSFSARTHAQLSSTNRTKRLSEVPRRRNNCKQFDIYREIILYNNQR